MGLHKRGIDQKRCQSNYDWVGGVSKERQRLLAEYEYLLNFSVVSISTVGAVRSIKDLKVKINSLYTILSSILNPCRSIRSSVI